MGGAPGSGVSKKCPESVPGVSGQLFDTPGTLEKHYRIYSAKVKRGREKGDGKNSVTNCRKNVVTCRDALYDAFMMPLCHMSKASEMS